MVGFMKYIYILFLLIQSITLCSQTYQLSGSVNIQRFDSIELREKENVYITLNMMDEHFYCLNFDVAVTNDIIRGTFLSYGKIDVIGNKYYLTDISCGYQLILEKQGKDTFEVKQGFYFLMGKKFHYYRTYMDDSMLSLNDIEKERLEREKCESYYVESRTKDRVPLQLGTYWGECNLAVSIMTNNRYKIFLEPSSKEYYLLSEGAWTKNGNELSMYDPNLDYSFLCLIREKNLIRVRFPTGTCPGVILFPQKDKMYPFIMR